jgi:integrase
MTWRRTCAKLCRKAGGDLEQIQILLGHASVQTTERYLGTDQNLTVAVNDVLGLRLQRTSVAQKTGIQERRNRKCVIWLRSRC